MTFPVDPHEPRPEFVSHLEWQIRSAIRRETRLTAPVGGARRFRAAAAIAAALIVGVAGGVASGQVQDARQRQLLMLRASTEMQLVQTRYELAKAEYEQARTRFEVGLAGRESVSAAEQHVRAMQTELKRLQLNLAEVQATSAPPNDALDAPLVGQRDFVRERQMLDLMLAEQTLAAAEREMRDAVTRAGVGLASETARLQAEAEQLLARQRLQELKIQLDLRQQFLAGKVHAADLAIKQRHDALQLALQRAEQEIVLARAQLERVNKLADRGLVAQLEVKRAEIRILEREVELQRIRAELAALKGGREDAR